MTGQSGQLGARLLANYAEKDSDSMSPNDLTPTPTTGATDPSYPSYPERRETGSQGLRSRVSGLADQARDKASEFGRTAATTIDRNLDTAAAKLQNTASTLRNKAAMRSDKLNRFANTTADRLDDTAQYFRTHHTREMVDDAGHVIRRNPAASMAAALAVGFILGSSFRRDRHY
jgi:ElaB/YqjD/DUF883 family membrane-anchored ribosome-binding protein